MRDTPGNLLLLATAVLVEISATFVVEFSSLSKRPKNSETNPAGTRSGMKADSGASTRQTTGALRAQEID
jgi:hypothetical protein